MIGKFKKDDIVRLKNGKIVTIVSSHSMTTDFNTLYGYVVKDEFGKLEMIYECKILGAYTNVKERTLVNIVVNLNLEVQKAGGTGWDYDQLERMSALELLKIIAPNNITFKYTRPNSYKVEFE